MLRRIFVITQDHPLAIGEGQTISAPHMHAICLELLEPHLTPAARVLDVGSGAAALEPHMLFLCCMVAAAFVVCLELLEPHLTPGARVLDVGSGAWLVGVAWFVFVVWCCEHSE